MCLCACTCMCVCVLGMRRIIRGGRLGSRRDWEAKHGPGRASQCAMIQGMSQGDGGAQLEGAGIPLQAGNPVLAIAVGRVGGRRGLPTAPTLCLAREATMSMLFGVPAGKLFARQAELKPLALAYPASVSLGQASHPHLHPQPCFVCSDRLSIFHCGAYCLILCELLLV